SGGRPVRDWQPYQGEILQAELPGSKGGKWKFRRLFFNGEPQIRARYPNFDPENPLYGGWVFTEDAAEPGSESAFKYRPDTFARRWAKPTEAEANIFSGLGWANDIITIKELDEATRTITLVHGTKDHDRPWNYESNPFRPGNRFFVENLLEELDQPGEWCLDSEEGRLYFWPPTPLAEGEVVAPYLDCLISLRGAAWITISGFTLSETTDGDNYLHDGGEGYGPMTPIAGWKYCGDAIHLRDSAYCCIEENRIYAVGGNGIYLEEYNLRHTIRRNEIAYAGANGIVLLGSKRRHPAPEELSRWEGRNRHQSHKQPHPQFNQIVDNHIHHCGSINKYVAAIFMGVSDGNLIAHNLIEYMPHHGINLGTNSYGRNILEYNIVRHVALETHDTGAINSWMEDEYDSERVGHVIRFNLIDDVRGCHFDDQGVLRNDALTFGIYLDNYTSNCFVYGNIVTRATGTGITVHCGKNNIFENNIIIGGTWQVRYQYHYYVMPGFLTGNRFCRNILYTQDPKTHLFCLHRWSDYVLAESDYNLFFKTSDPPYTIVDPQRPPIATVVFPLAQWQEMGYDQNSLVADPLFVDLEAGDYRLHPDSPALKLGFVPLDVSKIGIRPRA
ncbi:MAG TPA: right-handed parallel beta-helix repeat-containing protein, partial [Caldilineaceae bacterium]|nr:right-handed parallel beta-helix repeat-containing protein [Caldilineaceae bacterium]